MSPSLSKDNFTAQRIVGDHPTLFSLAQFEGKKSAVAVIIFVPPALFKVFFIFGLLPFNYYMSRDRVSWVIIFMLRNA